ncbi:glycosyltransferase family 2 protein [Aureispira anguillae]|uniref:glycosyltransferase family 2 protein n=1 Tax=Aureispira anguillae TaxID=2864201 RepID=UPI00222F796E|nr:glycosyltransferase family 2 protein [Aureispira anguillae]
MALIIPAYNELEYLDQKIKNCFELQYPSNLLKLIFVTDGSNDGSDLYLKKYEQITNYHLDERKGKIAAMNRVAPQIKADIIVFSDANAMLNKEALMEIATRFNDPKVGCVAGEKRIVVEGKSKATNAGEGFYWKYESALKNWSSQLNSAIGAAGELFAVRTELFEAPKLDTILDDFIISLSVVRKGFKIAYTKEAYALEYGSLTIQEEMKRKIRICTGGVQAIQRTLALLNPFRYPLFAFQYLSHRCLRWTITPIALVLLIPINTYLAYNEQDIYFFLGILQALFYFLGFLGFLFKTQKLQNKFLFIPFYFLMMNFSALVGMKRFFFNEQSVLWEKSQRLKTVNTESPPL